jgi:ABC-type amino acid transport substrate-binding protein
MKNKTNFLIGALTMLFLVGCGGAPAKKINDISDLKGKTIGMLAINMDLKGIEQLVTFFTGPVKKVDLFNRTSDEVAAVLTGKIDAFIAPDLTINYYAKRNTNLKIIPPAVRIEGTVFMRLRSEDMKLKAELDSAITILRENGTLKSLEDYWITNLPISSEPAYAEIPKIEGAKTIYVGVTGDYPPLDYIAADGRPAGYNVAMLKEIGKILKINFEFVSIESLARYAALGSKKIDVIFCNIQAISKFSDEIDNKNLVSTIPYCNFLGGYFLVKN